MPSIFDPEVVCAQLQALAVVAMAKQRLHGYAVRLSFREFLDRFEPSVLIPQCICIKRFVCAYVYMKVGTKVTPLLFLVKYHLKYYENSLEIACLNTWLFFIVVPHHHQYTFATVEQENVYLYYVHLVTHG